MSHGVLKQHQVQGSVDLIVAVQHLQQGFVEAAPGLSRRVPGLPQAAGEVAVQVHVPGLLQSLLHVLREGHTHTQCRGKQRDPDTPVLRLNTLDRDSAVQRVT